MLIGLESIVIYYVVIVGETICTAAVGIFITKEPVAHRASHEDLTNDFCSICDGRHYRALGVHINQLTIDTTAR